MLNFDRRFTQRAFNQDDALSGNAIASFLLGGVSGGAIDNNFYPTLRWNYSTPWFQDDWRVSERLTLNLGVRWDINTPVFEKENRLNYGFDTDTVNPVSARIQQRVLVTRCRRSWIRGHGDMRQYPYSSTRTTSSRV